MTAIGKSQLPKAAVLLFTNALGAALSVCFANFSKHIINGATEYKDWGYVVRYAVYLLILIMVQMALNLIGSSFSERCKARLDMIFKKHMLQVLIKKDYASVSKYHTGELNNLLFNDVQVITDGYTTLLPNVVFFIKDAQARYLLAVSDSGAEVLEAAALTAGVQVTRVGTFGGDTVGFGGDSAPLAELSRLYRTAFAAKVGV